MEKLPNELKASILSFTATCSPEFSPCISLSSTNSTFRSLYNLNRQRLLKAHINSIPDAEYVFCRFLASLEVIANPPARFEWKETLDDQEQRAGGHSSSETSFTLRERWERAKETGPWGKVARAKEEVEKRLTFLSANIADGKVRQSFSEDEEAEAVGVRQQAGNIRQSIVRGMSQLGKEPDSEPQWSVERMRESCLISLANNKNMHMASFEKLHSPSGAETDKFQVLRKYIWNHRPRTFLNDRLLFKAMLEVQGKKSMERMLNMINDHQPMAKFSITDAMDLVLAHADIKTIASIVAHGDEDDFDVEPCFRMIPPWAYTYTLNSSIIDETGSDESSED